MLLDWCDDVIHFPASGLEVNHIVAPIKQH
jgi:hypothetical protein